MIKAYASYFVSYLINNFKKIENISKVILFGSAAKEEASKSSDIDLFIEVKKNSKGFEKEIINLVNDFYKSREALIFKTKGIDNKINVIVGKLEDWADLRKSIESTGIVLYGNYIASDVKGKKHIIFFWDKIGKNRGAFLNKIYGFSSNGKRYIGLIELFNGSKLGKSSFMVSAEYREDIVKLLKHYRVNSKIIDVYV
ncbi:nucleotidyltransferase domain-containing protein [Candidatus Pacearchaeota archaeon]|nr:nucleotidyltransferase domain-containing protein [Candidatus Pacearchaeota archaeon]